MTDLTTKKIVIVGGNACGCKTAAVLARRLPKAEITIYQKDDHVSFATCGLPYYASGEIPALTALRSTAYGAERSPEFFAGTKGVKVITGAEVISIDRTGKTVTVKLPASGEAIEKNYCKLVLATGAMPNRPDFSFPESDRIGYFTRPQDAEKFRRLAEKGEIGRAVIIGGGFIGCELAEACSGLWGIETTLLEKRPHLLPYVLDSEMAAIVRREMEHQGVSIITSAEVTKVDRSESGNPIVYLAGRDSIEADYLFLCLGVRPNSSLAAACGLQIGPTGGIVVNSRMQTSDPDAYAGGDCVESVSLVSGKRFFIPMGSLANRHGRVIAENIAGNQAEFKGVLGTFLVKVFDLNVGAVGLCRQTSDEAQIDTQAVWGTFPDRAEYMPELKGIVAKLVYSPDDGRIIGLQAVGKGDIFRRIDVASALMQKQGTVDDVLDFEHGYAPPYSEALDPLHQLAAMAQAQRRGISFIDPGSDLASLGHDVVWLDVRETGETETEPWPYNDQTGGKLLCIPLNDLRNRLKELDRGHRIIIICKRGPRSYQAANILRSAGFDDVHVLGGGYQAALL